MKMIGGLLVASLAFGAAPSMRAQEDLAWLEGCWVSADGKDHEVWSEVYGGTRFGYSTSETDGRLRFFEHLRIEIGSPGSGSAGVTRYLAYPAGRGPTVFVADEITERSVTFVNGDHDYPQRIAYARDGDTLSATISLLDGQRPRVFVKMRC